MKITGLKTSIDRMPEPMQDYSRHCARWKSRDGHGSPVKHCVVGPMFKESDPDSTITAIIHFGEILSQKLRDHPPYTGEFKDGKWT